MTKAVTIGIDIAKNVFHLHGAAANGAVVFQRKLSRGRLLDYLAGLAPCLVGVRTRAVRNRTLRANEAGTLGSPPLPSWETE
jgi:transposase